MVYECGNTLSFVRSDGSHIRSLKSEGSGVTALAVCHKTGYIAYAECTLKPKIFVATYPMCHNKCTLEGMYTIKLGVLIIPMIYS